MTRREDGYEEPSRAAEPAAFRETFLTLFSPEEAAVVRKAGVYLHRKAQAGDPYHPPEPLGVQELFATGRDLASVAAFLQIMSRAPEAYEGMTETERALAACASKLAGVIEELVTAITGTVAYLLSEDEEETP